MNVTLCQGLDMPKIIKYTPSELEWIFSLLPSSFDGLKRRSGLGEKKLRKILTRLHKDRRIMYNITDKMIEVRRVTWI